MKKNLKAVIHFFKTLLLSSGETLQKRKRTWVESLPEETGFWEQWLRTRGMEWPEDFQRRLDPDTLLSVAYSRFIDDLPDESIDILDVGAGPLTILGKKHPTKQIHLTAVDPLARQYDRLLAKYNVIPPVRTIYGEAEKLVAQFGENRFDLITAINCIDHTYNPVEAVSQMVRAAKSGRVVFLSQRENEGDRQYFQGLHQHNLTAIDGDFFVVSKNGQRTNVSTLLSGVAAVECHLEDQWLNVTIRKY